MTSEKMHVNCIQLWGLLEKSNLIKQVLLWKIFMSVEYIRKRIIKIQYCKFVDV